MLGFGLLAPRFWLGHVTIMQGVVIGGYLDAAEGLIRSQAFSQAEGTGYSAHFPDKTLSGATLQSGDWWARMGCALARSLSANHKML